MGFLIDTTHLKQLETPSAARLDFIFAECVYEKPTFYDIEAIRRKAWLSHLKSQRIR
jgi:hypothetical protein